MLEEYIDALNKAKHPVILAGYGVRASDTIPAFRAFIERTHIPVLLTWKGIDILPDDHPNYCGRPGSIGQRAANIIQQKADFLLVLGCRLDPDQVGFRYDNFAPNARKVIIDIDVHEGNKYPYQLIVSDIGEWLAHDASDVKAHGDKWLKWCKDMNVAYPACLPENLEGDCNLYQLANVLSDLCTAEDVLAIGSSGPSANITLQTWRVKDGQRFIFAPALGAMGTDVPAAIGACLASGRRTIVITGDGGFNLNAQELEVISRLQLPIKIFVASNGGYGSIADMQSRNFGHLTGCDESSGLTLPDIEKIAEAYGVSYHLIFLGIDIEYITNYAFADNTPQIIEVFTPLLQKQLPRVTTVWTDCKPETSPMEDMEPALPDGVLERLMSE